MAGAFRLESWGRLVLDAKLEVLVIKKSSPYVPKSALHSSLIGRCGVVMAEHAILRHTNNMVELK